MKTMNVFRFNDSATAPALLPGTAEVPQPGKNEILIRVHAAGVTPTELKWYPTTHTLAGGVRTGAIPGHEFSGVIEAVGEGVDPGKIGQAVFGMNDWFADGATAEYCVAASTSVAEKPSKLSHAEAATVPIGALTAAQGLFDRANLQSGERVLIHGGSGAVGIYAIQFAKRAGAQVITTGSFRNFDFLSQLGADEMIDYNTTPFEDRVKDLDVIFDTVGGDTLKRSWDILKPSGRLVTIAAESEGTKDDRIEKAFFIVEPSAEQLTKIAGLLDSGDLKTFVDASVPLSEAFAAYCGKIIDRRGHGKTVISILD